MRVSKQTIIHLLEKGIHIQTSMQKSIMRSVHFALIMKRGKILDVACNAIGSRSMGCGYTNRTIHAERAVLKKIGDHTKLDGAIMVVIRISRGTGEIMNSEPCKTCRPHLEKCMKEHGLKRVYYSPWYMAYAMHTVYTAYLPRCKIKSMKRILFLLIL